MRFLKVEKLEPTPVPGYQDVVVNDITLAIQYLNKANDICGMFVKCNHIDSGEALMELINGYIESDKRDIDDGK